MRIIVKGLFGVLLGMLLVGIEFSPMLNRITSVFRRSSRKFSSGSGKMMGQSGNKMSITEDHFVLKTPIKGEFPSGMEKFVIASGCFWGSEKGFWRFPGVFTTAVGYAGGSVEDPTYEQVCSGRTGHTEVVLVVYDPKEVSFVDLMRQFLQSHNPTQKNGQGNDSGTQYRGAFYYTTDDQKEIGEAAIKQYEKQLGSKIHTEIGRLDKFYYAEQYHQQYLARPGNRPYCSAQPTGINLAPFSEWGPAHLLEKHAPKFGEDFWKVHAPSPHCVLRQPNEKIQWPGKL